MVSSMSITEDSPSHDHIPGPSMCGWADMYVYVYDWLSFLKLLHTNLISMFFVMCMYDEPDEGHKLQCWFHNVFVHYTTAVLSLAKPC